jgi:hypothetical protein
MRGLAAVVLMALLPACQETFDAPAGPDLYRPPADFGIGTPRPSDDLGVPDLGADDLKPSKDAH